MMELIHGHESLLLWLTVVSIIALIASMVLIPWMIVHIPSDYFSHPNRQKKYVRDSQISIARLMFMLLKNILGIVFIIGGVAMLVMPGQGILTIVIGILLIDFPYKYQVESWIIKRPTILKSINMLRAKAKQSPLEV
ncbi:MAG: hypothetical protein B5M52_05330 [Helicobacteraceae bacterium 4484_230]|nr:MAG: hypothetical protein B5M52_05330 [Helicobacteraceae bacterium 4484_230]